MSAYVVVNYKIRNPGAYEAYLPAVRFTIEAYGDELIAAGQNTEGLLIMSDQFTPPNNQ